MTHSDREAQYVKETGNKKPDINEYNLKTRLEMFKDDLLNWYSRFSTWLSARLEKAEKENEEKTAWSIKILKRLNKVDSLLDRCSGTIASVIYPKERREYITNLLDEIAHFNQE